MTDAPTPRDVMAAITGIVAEELYHGVSYDDSGDNTNYHGFAKNVLAAILSALTAAGYVVEPGWQPIETAPRDGTNVLLWADGPVVGFWKRGGWELTCPGSFVEDSDVDPQPTHWRPRPAGPAPDA